MTKPRPWNKRPKEYFDAGSFSEACLWSLQDGADAGWIVPRQEICLSIKRRQALVRIMGRLVPREKRADFFLKVGHILNTFAIRARKMRAPVCSELLRTYPDLLVHRVGAKAKLKTIVREEVIILQARHRYCSHKKKGGIVAFNGDLDLAQPAVQNLIGVGLAFHQYAKNRPCSWTEDEAFGYMGPILAEMISKTVKVKCGDENDLAEQMARALAQLFLDFTNEMPMVYWSTMDEKYRGSFIRFWRYLLRFLNENLPRRCRFADERNSGGIADRVVEEIKQEKKKKRIKKKKRPCNLLIQNNTF